jgi:hypothetical protein
MSDARKVLEGRIASVLKPLGYTKRAGTWHRDHGKLISVVNLQKSQWGDDFYLNLGVYLKQLGSENHPAESRCHIRCRAEALAGMPKLPGQTKEVDALLNSIAVPWLDALTTPREVAGFLRSQAAHRCFVDRAALDALGVETSPPSA